MSNDMANPAIEIQVSRMNFYYVYLLLLVDGDVYTGLAGDLIRRIKEHEDGKVASTKYKRPIKLIHYEAYRKKSDALRREKFLKTTEGKRLLRQQIRDVLNQQKNNGIDGGVA